jgi:hypothetical protein
MAGFLLSGFRYIPYCAEPPARSPIPLSLILFSLLIYSADLAEIYYTSEDISTSDTRRAVILSFNTGTVLGRVNWKKQN